MLLNFSNHPSFTWSKSQMDTAIKEFGKVEDLPFPTIDPLLSSDQIQQLVEQYEVKIRKIAPTAVHLMGELTFTYALVNKLKSAGIPCIASTTERIIKLEENGNKTSTFRFVRFRPY